MLAVGSKCPKINFQMQNDAGYLHLFNEIQKHIDINKKEESTTESSEERKKNAFGVKYKLIKLLSCYINTMTYFQ